MKSISLIAGVILITAPVAALAQSKSDLSRALTLHASFDKGLDADFSRGSKACYFKQGREIVPAKSSDELQIDPSGGRFGGALWFPKKGNLRPQYADGGVVNYNDRSWSATVSVWLRLSPDEDLEPGYCDPVQIVGDDSKKGFIFLEWSKDETPRYFRYAIRPLFEIWNPTNVQWADIPFDKRPMVQVERAPFSRDTWTHVVFTLENLNDKTHKPLGKLFINSRLQGAIQNWDLMFGWDPRQVALVLGAAYVGRIDDLAVFNRALAETEVKQLFELERGVADLQN